MDNNHFRNIIYIIPVLWVRTKNKEVFFIAKKAKKKEVRKIAPKKAGIPEKTAAAKGKKSDTAWRIMIWILIIIIVVYLLSMLSKSLS